MIAYNCGDKGSQTVGVYAEDKTVIRYKELTFNVVDDRKPDSLLKIPYFT